MMKPRQLDSSSADAHLTSKDCRLNGDTAPTLSQTTNSVASSEHESDSSVTDDNYDHRLNKKIIRCLFIRTKRGPTRRRLSKLHKA